jgi:polyhydroxyalkanoate synthase
MASVFQLMTPVRSMTKYSLDLLDVVDDERKLMNFLRMEKWLADRPHHPGAAARQWLIELYKENRLAKGTFELGGEAVDLKRLTMPVLNVYALQDHIIPPPCSTALGPLVGTADYTELALPGGHVGVYVSSKSQGIVGETVFNWLNERQEGVRACRERSSAPRTRSRSSGTATPYACRASSGSEPPTSSCWRSKPGSSPPAIRAI